MMNSFDTWIEKWLKKIGTGEAPKPVVVGILALLSAFKWFLYFTMGCMVLYSLSGQGCLPLVIVIGVVLLLVWDKIQGK